jgi:hypothetical protein
VTALAMDDALASEVGAGTPDDPAQATSRLEQQSSMANLMSLSPLELPVPGHYYLYL